MSDQILNNARASRMLPQAVVDAAEATMRGTSYGEQYVASILNTKHGLTDEGSYVVATNPTPGTAVAYGNGGTVAAFADTTAAFVWRNNSSPVNPVSMYLDYLRLIIGGTVPASATSTHFAIKIDNANRAPTSLGTQITPQNLNLRSSRIVSGQLWCPLTGGNAPVVPAASANARLVARGTLRSVISVVQDEYELRFGAVDGPGGMAAAGAGRFITSAPPIVLGPQECAVICLWQPSGATNPLSFEFETGWWER